jgi:hypothetical protein
MTHAAMTRPRDRPGRAAARTPGVVGRSCGNGGREDAIGGRSTNSARSWSPVFGREGLPGTLVELHGRQSALLVMLAQFGGRRVTLGVRNPDGAPPRYIPAGQVANRRCSVAGELGSTWCTQVLPTSRTSGGVT